MRKISSYQIFMLGLILVTLGSVLVFIFLRSREFYGEDYLIYKPGASMPERSSSEIAVTNVSLLKQLTVYVALYWSLFVLIYFVIDKGFKITILKSFVWSHAALTFVGCVLLVFFF